MRPRRPRSSRHGARIADSRSCDSGRLRHGWSGAPRAGSRGSRARMRQLRRRRAAPAPGRARSSRARRQRNRGGQSPSAAGTARLPCRRAGHPPPQRSPLRLRTSENAAGCAATTGRSRIRGARARGARRCRHARPCERGPREQARGQDWKASSSMRPSIPERPVRSHAPVFVQRNRLRHAENALNRPAARLDQRMSGHKARHHASGRESRPGSSGRKSRRRIKRPQELRPTNNNCGFRRSNANARSS